MTTLVTQITSAKTSDLVFVSKTNELVTDSKWVSHFFGKRHVDVINKIKSLHCSHEFRCVNFFTYHQKNEQNGEIYQAYQMTKDGFMFLVMGFTGKRAAEIKERYINAFNEMERQLSNKSLPAPTTPNCLILLTIENGQASGSRVMPEDAFLTSPDKLASQISESFRLFTKEQLQDIALECLNGVKRQFN